MENILNKVGTQPEWAARFWSKVDRSGGEAACWPWTAGLCQGYGRIKIGGRGGRQADAHRLAWELAHGEVPAGMVVRHSCDNRACCNLSHLSVGTVRDNNKDRDARGRTARGEKNGAARLSEDDVRAIRLARHTGTTSKTIAARYGISADYVRQIAGGRSWKHVI